MTDVEGDHSLGTQLQAQGYTLRGVAYNKSDRRVDVLLSADRVGASPQTGIAHLTRSIPHRSSVALTLNRQGKDRALQIKYGTSQTLLIIQSDPAPK